MELRRACGDAAMPVLLSVDILQVHIETDVQVRTIYILRNIILFNIVL